MIQIPAVRVEELKNFLKAAAFVSRVQNIRIDLVDIAIPDEKHDICQVVGIKFIAIYLRVAFRHFGHARARNYQKQCHERTQQTSPKLGHKYKTTTVFKVTCQIKKAIGLLECLNKRLFGLLRREPSYLFVKKNEACQFNTIFTGNSFSFLIEKWRKRNEHKRIGNVGRH